MKILVTGFEPFGGESRNPSAEVVEGLPGRIAGAEIVKCILPVERYKCVELVEQAAAEHSPHVILSIGQAGGRAAVTVERMAVNLDDYSIPDNGGYQPREEPVIPGGPDGYLVQLPVTAMVEAIRGAGIPAAVSMSAGTFVCNHLLYAVRHRCGVKNGFIHIPYLPGQVTDKPSMPSMGLEQSRRAVEIAIEVIVKETH